MGRQSLLDNQLEKEPPPRHPQGRNSQAQSRTLQPFLVVGVCARRTLQGGDTARRNVRLPLGRLEQPSHNPFVLWRMFRAQVIRHCRFACHQEKLRGGRKHRLSVSFPGMAGTLPVGPGLLSCDPCARHDADHL